MTTGTGGTTRPPARRTGRGTLEPRDDRMSVYWPPAVTGLFLLVLLLAFAGIPSRFFPSATPSPLPSVPLPSVSIPVSPSIEIIPPSGSPSVLPSPTPAP